MGRIALALAIVGCATMVVSEAMARTWNPRAMRTRMQRHHGKARALFKQFRRDNTPQVWLSGRRNRSIAARIKARLWRHQAKDARAKVLRLAPHQAAQAGKLRRLASRLEHKASRLSRATRRYDKYTRTTMVEAKQHVAQGNPVPRLTVARTSPEDAQRINAANPRSARARVRKQRLDFEGFAGAQPLTPAEVRKWLGQLPGGRRSVTRTGEQDGIAVRWTIKRTGRSRSGRAEGYVKASYTQPDTGEQVTVFHSTKASWARRAHEGSQAVMVLHHRSVRDRHNRRLLPAGTTKLASREVLRDSVRVSTSTETLDGTRTQRMHTYRLDGQEHYESYGSGEYFVESKTQSRGPSGWRTVRKEYDRGTLLVEHSDSSGKTRRGFKSAKAVERLFRRLEQVAGRQPTLARHKGGAWIWREVLGNYGGGVGTIRANGKRGELGAIRSAFRSPLGTEYGVVKNTRRGHHKSPTGRAWSVKSPAPQTDGAVATPPPKKIRARRAAIAQDLVNAVRKQPLDLLFDKAAGFGNAFAQPWDNKVYSAGGHSGAARAVTNGHATRLHPSLTHQSLPTLVGIALHEGGHEYQAASFTSPRALAPSVRANQQWSGGSPLQATVSSMISADINRKHERGADKAAGKGLAQVRKLTGDRRFTPVDMASFLRKGFKRPTWSPHEGYDPNSLRARSLNRAYRREMSKP